MPPFVTQKIPTQGCTFLFVKEWKPNKHLHSIRFLEKKKPLGSRLQRKHDPEAAAL